MEDRQKQSPNGEIESLNERILDEDLDDAAGGFGPCTTFSGVCETYWACDDPCKTYWSRSRCHQPSDHAVEPLPC